MPKLVRWVRRTRRLLAPLLASTLLVMTAVQAEQPPADATPRVSWTTAEPGTLKVDPQSLTRLRQYLEQDAHVRSLLIVRRDHLVFEYNRSDVAADALHSVASVTKNVVSALTGIALAQGHLTSLDQKVVDFFPELVNADLHPGTREISLRHLLTMTSGFSWNERSSFTPDKWSRIDDPIGVALKREPILPPGKVFNYDSASTNLLAIALSRAVGTSLEQYAQQHLFGPLGLTRYEWAKDRQGHNAGSHGLRLSSRDMATFGNLYLHRGQHAGKQLIPASYVDESLQPRIAVNPGERLEYGYLWWLSPTPGNQRAFSALGFGGQAIYVVPDLDLVVVIASNQDKAANSNRTIIREMILPAVTP